MMMIMTFEEYLRVLLILETMEVVQNKDFQLSRKISQNISQTNEERLMRNRPGRSCPRTWHSWSSHLIFTVSLVGCLLPQTKEEKRKEQEFQQPKSDHLLMLARSFKMQLKMRALALISISKRHH
jgi:hypothetical protein